VATAFLKSLEGGLPIPEHTATSPYAVAQAELAFGARDIPGAANIPRIVLSQSTTKGGGALGIKLHDAPRLSTIV
jgi:hypothetical protein